MEEKRNIKRKKKRKANLSRLIPVAVAIVLIILIVCIFYGQKIIERYSYTSERADLYEYFEIMNDDEIALTLQNEHLEEKGKQINGVSYFDMDTINQYFTERFYVNIDEGIVLYTTNDQIIKAPIGEEFSSYFRGDEEIALNFPAAVQSGESVYLAADYLKLFVNFSYELFTEPNHMTIYTQWGTFPTGIVNKETQLRYQGGVKSQILEDLAVGDTVYVLETMENWSKVISADGMIGYVENKKMDEGEPFVQTPVTEVAEIVYPSISKDYKINMGFHQVFAQSANSTFDSYAANTKEMNVISPTWFRLLDSEGNMECIASSDYVSKAHSQGMEVWALFTDVDYEVDLYPILSTQSGRAKLISAMIGYAAQYDLDGINLDFESVDGTEGEHFVQFLRELSIQTHANGIVLSVDNYAPTASTQHYNRTEQGIVADYVVIMGYDEHWGGSQEVGSVASINFVENGILKTMEEVPAEKIINAIPFYTRLWKTENGTVTSEALGMDAAKEWVDSNGVELTWNAETCQYYGELQKGNALYQIWLEEEESIQVKLNVMNANNVAGVAEWKLGFERPSVWDVIAGYTAM